MNKIRFGLIGAGNSASNIATSLATLDAAELVAVSAKTMEEANTIGDKHNIAPRFSDYKEMLALPKIEAVIISVPHFLHYQMTLDALNAGKHVLCEKPLAINTQQGNEMIALAKEKDLRLGTFFQMRFSDASIRAKEIVESGKIGTILHAQTHVMWYRDQEYYDSSPWRGKWKTEGGGSLINQSSHSIDLMMWIMGDPERLFGVYGAKTHKIEVDDNSAAVIRFQNGAFGVIQTSLSLEPGYTGKVNIYGTKGMVSIFGNELDIVDNEGKKEHQNFDESQVGSANDPKKFSLKAQTALLSDFIDAIQNHREPKVNGEEGLRAIKVIEGIYQSNGEKIITFE